MQYAESGEEDARNLSSNCIAAYNHYTISSFDGQKLRNRVRQH